MSKNRNELGQPIGYAVPNWALPPRPDGTTLSGRYCRVEPLPSTRHVAALYSAVQQGTQGSSWSYLPYGPFDTLTAYRQWLDDASRTDDPLFFAIVDSSSDRALGVASYLRINPTSGSIEVGHIHFSPLLQRQAIIRRQ